MSRRRCWPTGIASSRWTISIRKFTERTRVGRPTCPREPSSCVGNVRDRELLRKLLAKADAVIHLAAAVGVGQSMYKIEHYCSVSVMGTAVLLEELLPLRKQIKKLIVASSMSIYGEGAYRDAQGRVVCPGSRAVALLKKGQWEPVDAEGRPLEPIPTGENKPLQPDSIYAINKRDQEEMCLTFGRAYDLPVVAFRMFNVYGAPGPFQSLHRRGGDFQQPPVAEPTAADL